MPIGFRCVVLAAVGWLILCGAQSAPKETDRTESTQQAAPVIVPTPTVTPSPSPAFTPYPDYYPDPCYRAQDKDAADLCAQWRSAIAAEKAAHEARRGATWSIVATFLSAFSLLVVGGALYFSVESNNIARDTAQRQLRAYVTISSTQSDIELEGQSSKMRSFGLRVIGQNSGQTPAKLTHALVEPVWLAGKARPRKKVRTYRKKDQFEASLGSGIPNRLGRRIQYGYEDASALFSGEKRLYLYIWLRYEDIFRVERETHHVMQIMIDYDPADMGVPIAQAGETHAASAFSNITVPGLGYST